MRASSFQSASVFPAKLLGYVERFRKRGLSPVHLSLSLTNECQLRCLYCSQSDRDRDLKLDYDYLIDVLQVLRGKGLDAVTFTGGGEPLLYPRFPDVVEVCANLGLKMGLTTNGIALCDVRPLSETLARLDWVRISFDRYRKELPRVPLGLKHAFSYVFTKGCENDPNLAELIARAEKGTITHLRIVNDIFMTGDIKLPLPSDSKSPIVVQDRKHPVRGATQCWMGYVHPKLDADGKFYPCCGIQYALENRGQWKSQGKFSLGELPKYLERLWDGIPFPGNVCDRCYYGGHNELLDKIQDLNCIDYKEFV